MGDMENVLANVLFFFLQIKPFVLADVQSGSLWSLGWLNVCIT